MNPSTTMRLNRFLARAGLCSRRKADILIRQGQVKVNGQVVTQMGFQVSSADVVKFQGEKVAIQRQVYILLNKPIQVVTTTDDPQGRTTILDLLEPFDTTGLFPVGRLDWDTTGLLLITNDGALAQTMAHPKYEIQKVYYAYLNRPLESWDLKTLYQGVKLKDGVAVVDHLRYLNKKRNSKKVVLSIHMGRKRVVRRLFSALGYEVERLDRIQYASLTKKGLGQGQWRHLTEEEVGELKEMVHPL